jgi:hypothetical protein
MAKIKKAQVGAKAKASKDSVPSEMNPGKMIPKTAVRKGAYITVDKPAPKKKMKDGGKSFPDLNKDGKITKADILKGRGVIAKSGKKVSKQSKKK